MPQTVQASGRTAHTGSVSSSLTRAVHVVSVSLTEGAVPVPRVLYSVYTASSMCRRTATTCSLLVVAAALLLLPLLGSCAAVSAHRLPHHAPAVLLLGGGAGSGAWERGGRTSPAQGSPREGRELAARRLGKRPSLETPPSPKPHGMTGMVMPLPPPPPPPPPYD